MLDGFGPKSEPTAVEQHHSDVTPFYRADDTWSKLVPIEPLTRSRRLSLRSPGFAPRAPVAAVPAARREGGPPGAPRAATPT